MSSRRGNVTRTASHAGSWYTDSPSELNRELDQWLSEAGKPTHGPARAIIAPHAGFRYSGPTAAYAYKEIDASLVRRVFILGPSHHVRLSRCALSPCTAYSTPIGDMTIDHEIYQELKETGHFEEMSLKADEDEHSMEMHLPFICKVMKSRAGNFTIVPILVGSLSFDNEKLYGQLLAKYLIDSSNLFVISSDFCHWGSRFQYTYHDESWGQIHESIDKLDHLGMDIIESIKPKDFKSYLSEFGNTICGRHPIAVLLQAASEIMKQQNDDSLMSLKFLKYDQSSKCNNFRDSSVSYASASLKFNREVPN